MDKPFPDFIKDRPLLKDNTLPSWDPETFENKDTIRYRFVSSMIDWSYTNEDIIVKQTDNKKLQEAYSEFRSKFFDRHGEIPEMYYKAPYIDKYNTPIQLNCIKGLHEFLDSCREDFFNYNPIKFQNLALFTTNPKWPKSKGIALLNRYVRIHVDPLSIPFNKLNEYILEEVKLIPQLSKSEWYAVLKENISKNEIIYGLYESGFITKKIQDMIKARNQQWMEHIKYEEYSRKRSPGSKAKKSPKSASPRK